MNAVANDNDKVKVSVIIPVYNCQNTIEATVVSVLNQTMSDFELLLLNDGSTDETLKVITRLSENCSYTKKIRVTSLENGGPAKARNVGLSQACADYVYFMDSDDILEPTMLEKLLSAASAVEGAVAGIGEAENGFDIVCCGYFMEQLDKNGNVSVSKVFSLEKAENGVAVGAGAALEEKELGETIMALCSSHLMYTVWNKLYKRSFLLENGLDFKCFMSGEDRLFNLTAAEFVKKLCVISEPLYHYYIRPHGLAGRYVKDRFDAALLCDRAMALLVERFIEYGDYSGILNTAMIKQAVSSIVQLFGKGCPLTKKEKRIEISRILQSRELQRAAAYEAHKKPLSKSGAIGLLLKSKSVTAARITGFSIHILQTKFGPFFLRLKHGKD